MASHYRDFGTMNFVGLEGFCRFSCHNYPNTQLIICLILWLNGLEGKQKAWTDAFEIRSLLTRIWSLGISFNRRGD